MLVMGAMLVCKHRARYITVTNTTTAKILHAIKLMQSQNIVEQNTNAHSQAPGSCDNLVRKNDQQ